LEERRGFRDVLEKDGEVEAALGAATPALLAEAFDLERALTHAHRTIDALGDVPETRS
jgi:hypothetical protein